MISISDKTVGKLLTLVTLSTGIAIGFVCGAMYHPGQEVRAQAIIPQPPTVQEVSPTMTAGSIGTGLLLAHTVASDQLLVNGYDVLKMQQNMLNYLANQPLAERAAIQNIINASVSPTVYRYKSVVSQQNVAPKTTPEKK